MLDAGGNAYQRIARIPDRNFDAAERLLGEALDGDAMLFTREDAVEAAWRELDEADKAAAATPARS